MIIGNNKDKNFNQQNFTSNFNERFTTIVNESNKNKDNLTSLNNDQNFNYHRNVNNKNEMADKSFAMLQERYNKGLISIDEFTKKCNQLNKLRQK